MRLKEKSKEEKKEEKEKKRKRNGNRQPPEGSAGTHKSFIFGRERETESKHGGLGIFMASANSKTPGDCFENAHSPASIKQPDAHNFCCQPSSLIFFLF